MYDFEYDSERFHRKERVFKTKLFAPEVIEILKKILPNLNYPMYGGNNEKFSEKLHAYLRGGSEFDCFDEMIEVFRTFERDTIAIDSISISDDEKEVTIVYRVINSLIDDKDYEIVPRILHLTTDSDDNIGPFLVTFDIIVR